MCWTASLWPFVPTRPILFFGGYNCIKGRQLVDAYGHESRITKPQKKCLTGRGRPFARSGLDSVPEYFLFVLRLADRIRVESPIMLKESNFFNMIGRDC